MFRYQESFLEKWKPCNPVRLVELQESEVENLARMIIKLKLNINVLQLYLNVYIRHIENHSSERQSQN